MDNTTICELSNEEDDTPLLLRNTTKGDRFIGCEKSMRKHGKKRHRFTSPFSSNEKTETRTRHRSTTITHPESTLPPNRRLSCLTSISAGGAASDDDMLGPELGPS